MRILETPENYLKRKKEQLAENKRLILISQEIAEQTLARIPDCMQKNHIPTNKPSCYWASDSFTMRQNAILAYYNLKKHPNAWVQEMIDEQKIKKEETQGLIKKLLKLL